jgi:hypothetical protein
MTKNTTKTRIAGSAVLTLLLALAILALAGVSAAGNGHGGKGHGKGKAHGKSQSASAAQYQYSSGGKQYGLHRVPVCHKGHTIYVAQPAVKAHVNHGDHAGAC